MLSIRLNDQLSEMDGLSRLRKVGGRVMISDNTLMTHIDDLSGLKEIGYWDERDFYFRSLTIEDNPVLDNLDGLSNLSYLGGSLTVNYNFSLDDVDGLSGLTSIGEDLNVVGNISLNRCCGLYPLLCNDPPACSASGVPGTINISGNGAGCTPTDIIADGPCS